MVKRLPRPPLRRLGLCGLALFVPAFGPSGCLINPKDYPVETSANGGDDAGGQTDDAGSSGGGAAARGGTIAFAGNGGSAARAGSDAIGGASGSPSVGGTGGGGGTSVGGSPGVGGEAGADEPQSGTGGQDGGGASSSAGTGGGAGTTIQGGSGGAAPTVKRVFVTSQTFTGDFRAYANPMEPNGLNGANIVCNQAASGAGLGGQWVAWLSVTGDDAIHRINDVAPWYLVDRSTKVFDTHDQLALPANVLINMTEHGDTASGPAWTGTTLKGVAHSARCGEWTNSGSSLGAWGDTGNAFDWSYKDTNRCSTTARLYCFEQ